MATTTLVDPAVPSGLFGGHFHNPRRHSYGMSPTAYSSHSPSPLAYSSLSTHDVTSPTSHTPVASSSASPSMSTGSLHQATHAKLHKKSHRKAFSSSHVQGSTDSLSSRQAALSRTDTPPISEDHAASFAHNTFPRSSTASRSFKMRRGMRRSSQQGIDASPGIDLSRTAEENAERSGIAVTQSQANVSHARRLSDVQFVRTRGHGRNMSAPSNKGALSGSFTPSLPFVHPMRQQPEAAPSEAASDSSQVGTSSPLTGLGIEGAQTSELRRSMSSSREAAPAALSSSLHKTRRSLISSNVAAASDLDVSRPTHARTFSQSSYASPSQVSLIKNSRSRRGTAASQQSIDNMHSSRTSFSLERATSFMRSPAMDPMELAKQDLNDAEKRAERASEREAHIKAARRAFTEREEAKNRKYEKQERKAAERRDRKRAKDEERERRKSENAGPDHRPVMHQRSYSGDSRPSTRRRAATLPSDLAVQDSLGARSSGDRGNSSIEEEEREDEFQSALATPAEAQNPWNVDDSTASDLNDEEQPRASVDSRTSRKRQAKSGYYGFMTWVKVRMLRMHDKDRNE